MACHRGEWRCSSDNPATEASVHCKVLVLSSVGLKYITWQGDGEGICRSNV